MDGEAFELDPVLAADTVEVTRWPMCRVLLMNDSRYPWLVLVPQRAGVTELHHLSEADRNALMGEVARAASTLEDVLTPDKINVAALGNVVSQLHVHVIARFHRDPAWPKPIWGVHPPLPYEPEPLARWLEVLRAAMA